MLLSSTSSTSSSVELLVKNTMSVSVQAESNAAGPSMERKVVSQRASANSPNGHAIAAAGIALNPSPDKMLHVRTLSADVPHTNMVWVTLLQQYWATASGADEETFPPAPAARQQPQQLSVQKSLIYQIAVCRLYAAITSQDEKTAATRLSQQLSDFSIFENHCRTCGDGEIYACHHHHLVTGETIGSRRVSFSISKRDGLLATTLETRRVAATQEEVSPSARLSRTVCMYYTLPEVYKVRTQCSSNHATCPHRLFFRSCHGETIFTCRESTCTNTAARIFNRTSAGAP